MDSSLTLELLDKLEKQGFTDAAFSKVHHHREKGEDRTIQRFRTYIDRPTARFQERSNNALVHRRLEIVWNAYRGGGFTSRSSDVFVALAEAAYLEAR
jgi:hypothetical protein